jgi:hypothetical protein
MSGMLIETVVEPYLRDVREKNIPSLRRQQVQQRELQLIRMRQEQSAQNPRQTGIVARIAALWSLVAERSAGPATS